MDSMRLKAKETTHKRCTPVDAQECVPKDIIYTPTISPRGRVKGARITGRDPHGELVIPHLDLWLRSSVTLLWKL